MEEMFDVKSKIITDDIQSRIDQEKRYSLSKRGIVLPDKTQHLLPIQYFRIINRQMI
jgi:hypothetical protein